MISEYQTPPPPPPQPHPDPHTVTVLSAKVYQISLHFLRNFVKTVVSTVVLELDYSRSLQFLPIRPENFLYFNKPACTIHMFTQLPANENATKGLLSNLLSSILEDQPTDFYIQESNYKCKTNGPRCPEKVAESVLD